jgi:hypothetical protein
MNKWRITNQKQLRREFWEAFPDFAYQAREAGIISKGQNAQCATVRCTFCDWIDALCRAGDISQALADRATL